MLILGVTNVNIDLPNKKVEVIGTATDDQILEAIKKTGKKTQKWAERVCFSLAFLLHCTYYRT